MAFDTVQASHDDHALAQREEGAVAIVVAVSLIAMLGLAAFAVDFGLSYTSKRQLQTGVDAAALAAASVYVDEPGDCAALASDGSLASAAQTDGAEIMAMNHPGSTQVGSAQIACDAGRLVVRWEADATTDVGLGAVFGGGPITTTRHAVAMVGVPGSGTGLRPFAVCSAAIPDVLPSGPIRIDYDGFVSTGQCPEGHNSGNWWTLDCPSVRPPEPAPAGNALLVWRVANGCASPLSVVDGQEPFYGSPAGLSSHLLDTPTPCNGSADEDCLGADTGNVRSNGVRTEWTNLLGDEVTFPVICGSYTIGSRPTCTPDAVHEAGGSNVEYPIHAFTGAVVCGHQFGNSTHAEFSNTGACAGTAAQMNLVNNKNYLVLNFTHVQMSGGIDPQACPLGDPDCDYGTRAVYLIE